MPLWQKRPCPIPLLKLMALSVIHLQPLRLALIDTLMMDYMALVDSYIQSSHYEPDELQYVSMVSHSFMSHIGNLTHWMEHLPNPRDLFHLFEDVEKMFRKGGVFCLLH